MRGRGGRVFGRLIVTTTLMPTGSPWRDKCFTLDADGRRYEGHAYALRPWNRNEWREQREQVGLVVAWRTR